MKNWKALKTSFLIATITVLFFSSFITSLVFIMETGAILAYIGLGLTVFVGLWVVAYQNAKP